MTLTVKYGGKKGKKISFSIADDLVAVRSHKPRSFARIVNACQADAGISGLEEVCHFEEANVRVMRVPSQRGKRKQRDHARKRLAPLEDVRFAGRALIDKKSKRPVLYTENFFVQFDSKASKSDCIRIIKKHKLSIKRRYKHDSRSFFVAAPDGTGLEKIFKIGERLLNESLVKYSHPELVRERALRKPYKNQWHLKETVIDGTDINAHANVVDAWALSTGEDIRIAIIDDGVDVDHQDFSGKGKVIHGRDATLVTNDPRPKNPAIPILDRTGDAHGTACAGVACANGEFSASGVAPDAILMPIRLRSALGSQAEHDAIVWAVTHGADVISCSWGPPDGDWWDPNDPLHDQITPLPDSTRVALEFAALQGRDGKGCAITWAAGNGNESADNDGYASSEFVMAIGACNDRSKKSIYSDFGQSLWCCFPSNDFAMQGRSAPLTPGIWTTDRSDGVDEGYNPSFSDGDTAGRYTNSFGGTSSSCPGVAGVAALIMSLRPDLTWVDVANIIAESCDRIDVANGDYDAETKHSYWYGFGRVNAANSLLLAENWPSE